METPEKRQRGRPKGTGTAPEIHYRGLHVKLPPEELEELRAAVPRGQRSEFIREAVREKLARREKAE